MGQSLTTMTIGQVVIVLFMSGCGRVPQETGLSTVSERGAPQYEAELEWTWSSPPGGPSTNGGPLAEASNWSHSGEEGPYELTCCLLKSQGACNIYAVILTVPQQEKEPLILSQLVNYQGKPLTVFDCHGQTVVIKPGRGLGSPETNKKDRE